MDDLHLLQEMERPFYVLIQVMGKPSDLRVKGSTPSFLSYLENLSIAPVPSRHKNKIFPLNVSKGRFSKR